MTSTDLPREKLQSWAKGLLGRRNHTGCCHFAPGGSIADLGYFRASSSSNGPAGHLEDCENARQFREDSAKK